MQKGCYREMGEQEIRKITEEGTKATMREGMKKEWGEAVSRRKKWEGWVRGTSHPLLADSLPRRAQLHPD